MTEHRPSEDARAEKGRLAADGAARRPELGPRARPPRAGPLSAPDEAAIRAAIYGSWARPCDGGLSLAAEFSDAFGAAVRATDDLWDTDDFRPSELDRYDALLSAAGTTVRRSAEVTLLEAIVAALVVFATEHPDAPRA